MSSAAVQFLLSLILLARLPVAEFGRLSFVFVVSQFSVGIWGALFTSPMLVLSAQATHAAGDGSATRELAGVAAVSVMALAPAAVAFTVIAWAVGLPPGAAVLFAGYATFGLLRQSIRVRVTAQGRYAQAMASDLTYSGLLLIGVATLAALPASGETAALAILAGAVAGAFVPFLSSLAGLARPRWRDAVAYRGVWSRDSRWSLVGLVTTEATVNSHSYIVTILLGPAAFAPIAATVLFIRPITVAINALVEFERARAAHRIARREFAAIASARLHLRLLLLAVWSGTAVVAAFVIALAPAQYMVGKFGLAVVATGTLLWLAVALARLLHAPEGVILLATGRFRQLAWISGWTAGLSLAAVTALVVLLTPVWSIAGIILGEGAFAFAAWRAATGLLREERS
jgi:hypothetical protein